MPPAVGVALCAAVALTGGCVFEPTEVLVAIGTDVPAAVPLALTVRVSRGRAASGDAAVQGFVRAPGDGGIALPATFAVVPGGGPTDGPVFVEIEANAGGVTLRRRASFLFTPRQALTLRVFLTAQCLAPATGCTSAGACTVLRLCEDQGQTCGDQGTCIEVPSALGTDPDGGFDAAPPRACGAYGQPCCYVGAACGGPLTCVSDRCQRCADPAEACCSGADLRPDGTVCAAVTTSGSAPGSCVAGVCTLPLDSPIGVNVPTDSATGVTVSWTASSGAASYTLEVDDSAGFATPAATPGIATTQHAVTGLTPGRRYSARVRAVAGDGRQSAWSAVASAVTDINAPGAPGVTVDIPGATRLTSACCWVTVPSPAGMYFYAHASASAACPAGSAVEYRFEGQYTSTAMVYGYTAWMGADAYMVQPTTGYGVRFSAQARCVGRDATSSASGTGSACRLRSGGGC